MEKDIPFCATTLCGKELEFISQALASGEVAGDGPFTKKCHAWLAEQAQSEKVLLTHSCTAALEIAALLAELEPGDEVIMPSFTFVSTANAFVLRGAIPVFIDIREDTLNMDERLLERALTKRTKAIVPVHYAGVSCEMDRIMEFSGQHNLMVIEDAAQGIGARYKGKALGTIGHLGALSFHQTKNISAGEGGALFVNVPDYVSRAEVIREKGTDRSAFFRGAVDKYTWRDIGSSYLPSDILAAFLYGQFVAFDRMQSRRMAIYEQYRHAFADISERVGIRLPFVPDNCQHNAHIFYLLLPEAKQRDPFIRACRDRGIGAVFHYVPLHSSPMGGRVCRVSGNMDVTDSMSSRIVRVPIYNSMTEEDVAYVIDALNSIISQSGIF